MYASLQEFEKVLKQKQVELELLEVKLAQKSVAVAQERENNVAERQCVSIDSIPYGNGIGNSHSMHCAIRA